MCLCSKQSRLFSFYALPSGGKSKGVVVHWLLMNFAILTTSAAIRHAKVEEEDSEHCQSCHEASKCSKQEPG